MSFQRFIDEVLRGLDFCFRYIDNLPIASATWKDHLEQVCTIFEWLADLWSYDQPKKVGFCGGFV